MSGPFLVSGGGLEPLDSLVMFQLHPMMSLQYASGLLRAEALTVYIYDPLIHSGLLSRLCGRTGCRALLGDPDYYNYCTQEHRPLLSMSFRPIIKTTLNITHRLGLLGRRVGHHSFSPVDHPLNPRLSKNLIIVVQIINSGVSLCCLSSCQINCVYLRVCGDEKENKSGLAPGLVLSRLLRVKRIFNELFVG